MYLAILIKHREKLKFINLVVNVFNVLRIIPVMIVGLIKQIFVNSFIRLFLF